MPFNNFDTFITTQLLYYLSDVLFVRLQPDARILYGYSKKNRRGTAVSQTVGSLRFQGFFHALFLVYLGGSFHAV